MMVWLVTSTTKRAAMRAATDIVGIVAMRFQPQAAPDEKRGDQHQQAQGQESQKHVHVLKMGIGSGEVKCDAAGLITWLSVWKGAAPCCC